MAMVLGEQENKQTVPNLKGDSNKGSVTDFTWST